jgi:hypothetical protein
MRVTLRPLDAAGDEVPLEGCAGSLWSGRIDWDCRDARLRAAILATEPCAMPEREPSEPVPGALARLLAAVRGRRALVLLIDPVEALGPERIGLAEGVRLLGVAGEGGLACWDRALTLGLPMYGVRGTVACDLVRPTPANVLGSLGFGAFTCEEGLVPAELSEDPHGVAWRLPTPGEASVVVRGGFEAARIVGAAGSWRDAGSEGYVRIEFAAGGGRCWTQPRFVAPRRDHGHGG